MRLAILTGALTAVGFLTKLNFIGFAPGVMLGLLLACIQTARHSTRGAAAKRAAAYRPLAFSLAIALSPILAYALVHVLSGRTPLGAASATFSHNHRSLLDEASYVWQFYLPRLPGMHAYFPQVLTTRQLWFDGLVGLYGWTDTLFAGWVYDLALIPAAVIAVLCVGELIRRRAAVRRRIPELVVYAMAGMGIMLVVGDQSYVADVLDRLEAYWAPRYLLPMLALWGLVVALAARGAGRRWGPVVGVLLIVLLLAHDVFSELQVIARFYG
jgi:hypothetical protein